ncbi:cytokine receptor family member b1 [Epinephelus moara]|uniref:cytokine receptor family member b1 n=1 Tax=Epinephelus moara TaxID=300413 RepID=UPI00214F4446|nr:cytokine receptor family member b1 [Epinephelus moara]XP_049904285.1 cytokine receptor family member b1 [Epinephelus moara]
MICLPLVLYLVFLLYSVLGSLPAPVNLSVSSDNFHHVLCWDPGPSTPPGTQYKIIRRLNKKEQKKLWYSNTTSFRLKLPRNREKYDLYVQAFYNQSLSPESSRYSFTPYEDTIIGPPKVSLAGCGNCIQINISLPEADRSSKISDIQEFYGAQFKIYWKKHNESTKSFVTQNKSYTVDNLQIGAEYCVQVDTKINVNKHTVPSAWHCTFTSIVEPSRDPVILGVVAALLIFAVGFLMSSMFCLHYTGFLCKLKAALPRVLIEALSQGYTLTPERTVPDKICISIETEKQRRHNNPTTPQPATKGTNSDEEDEEEEEEGVNVYMERDAELSSLDSSCQDSIDVSCVSSKVAASGNSRGLTVEAEVLDTEFEVEVTHGGFDQDGAIAEDADVSFMPEGHTGVKGHVTDEVQEEEEDKEVVCDSSCNINLFSVTLAALTVSEEGEEEESQNTSESHTDFLKLSDLELLLPSDSKQTSRHTDSQTESDHQTTMALMLPTQTFTAAGYEGRCAATLSGFLKTCDGVRQHEETKEEGEEEEEEEFSGYMAHT